MQTTIIKIGNSRGVRIPKTLLNESRLEGAVDISAKENKIIISPAKTKLPRYVNEEYATSLKALDDWNRPEEDEAWAYLQ